MTDLFIEEDLKEFISRLPDLQLQPPTVHLLMLAVRSRKAKETLGIKIRDLLISREIVRPKDNWRDIYYRKVQRLALLQHYGLYKFRDLDIPIQTRAIYATLSPRSVFHALGDLEKENISYMLQRDESSIYQLTKQDVRFFSKLHRHKAAGHHYVTLDIDVLDTSLLKEILDEVSILPIFMVTETSRGYHIVLDLSRNEDAKVFYGQEKLMQKLGLKYASKGLEIQRDSQEPVPGTLYYRGNNPHYVKLLQ